MKFFKKLRLRFYIKLHNIIYNKISIIATKLNKGIHPKHGIMNYYQYFLKNIDETSKVLDIGCGIGYLTNKLSGKAQYVVGIDINKKALDFAKRNFNRENIKFICADAMKYKFQESFDYIILSNVLEHLKERKKFLIKLKPLAKYLLIRVPMIDRSWLPLYKKKLGFEYRLDSTHYIEYTLESFKKEMASVGLEILSYKIKYGEIWSRIKI